MTLKKFLKKVKLCSGVPTMVYYESRGLGAVENNSFIGDEEYLDWRIKAIGVEVEDKGYRLTVYQRIEIKPPKKKPKRISNHEKYRKWMKKYVREHLDEIGLCDGEDAMD